MNRYRASKASKDGFIDVVEGVKRKTLVFGERSLLTEFRLEKGKKLPLHRHPHEQTGYLISGHLTLLMGDQRYDMTPGDSWSIPGGDGTRSRNYRELSRRGGL